MIEYFISIGTYVGFAVILALALNLQWGIAGMVNFGIAGFYALGAYTSAILTTTLGWPFLAGLVAAAAVGWVAGLFLALLSLRLSGHHLAIVTMGFGETVRLIALNEDWLTGGPRGLPIDVRPMRHAFNRQDYAIFYFAVVIIAVTVIYFTLERIRKAPLGRTLRAIRDDATVVEVLGKNVFGFRVRTFALGGLMMGAAGSLYAHYTQNISPDHFLPMTSITIWMAVILGGAGNNRGVLLGALTTMFVLEGSRFAGNLMPGVSSETLSSLRIIAIGVLLILIIRYRPQGILPEKSLLKRRYEAFDNAPTLARENVTGEK